MDDNKNSELPISLKDKKVCVMGLGFVGLTLAVTLADIGYEVYGVELRENVVKLLKKGKPHFSKVISVPTDTTPISLNPMTRIVTAVLRINRPFRRVLLMIYNISRHTFPLS